jgi:hypothetical protein
MDPFNTSKECTNKEDPLGTPSHHENQSFILPSEK